MLQVWRTPLSVVRDEGRSSVTPCSQKGTGPLLARKGWILRETDFTFGYCTSARATRMNPRRANHTGCPDGGDGFKPHPPDGPIAKNWDRLFGESTGYLRAGTRYLFSGESENGEPGNRRNRATEKGTGTPASRAARRKGTGRHSVTLLLRHSITRAGAESRGCEAKRGRRVTTACRCGIGGGRAGRSGCARRGGGRR
jgi:hypothetical protein